MLSTDELQPARNPQEAFDAIVRRSHTLRRRRAAFTATPLVVLLVAVLASVSLPGDSPASVRTTPADRAASDAQKDGQPSPSGPADAGSVAAGGIPGLPLLTTTTTAPAELRALTQEQLVFEGDLTGDGRRTIWRMDADGTDRHPVLTSRSLSGPALSPDRRWVAFSDLVSPGSTRRGLWMVPAGGGQPRLVAESEWTVTTFDWSPDGTTLVYSIHEPRPQQGLDSVDPRWSADSAIWMVRTDGTAGRLVLEDAEGPRWSADGSLIAFERDSYIHTMAPDGTGVTRIGPGRAPTWSPDGRQFAYELGGSVYLMNTDGSDGTNQRGLLLDSEETFYHNPSWSSDGRAIAVNVQEANGTYSVALVHPDGTGLRRVVTGQILNGARFPHRRH